MSTTWTPTRYPIGHPQAGAIIVDPEDDVLAEQPAAPAPATTPDPAPTAATPATPPAIDPSAPPRAFATLTGRPAATAERPAASGRDQVVTAAVAVAIVALLIYAATRQATPADAPAALPTAAVPTVLAPIAGPTVASDPAVTAMPPNTAPRALVAYFDYRDASTATPLERGAAYEPVGRAGDRWLLVRVAGAEVWALAEDLGATVDPALPDLAPRPAAPAPAPVAPAAPASAPAPAACVQTAIALDVSDAAGVPIGRVEGVGCTVAEAQANADQLAAELRASKAPTPAPTQEVRQ